MTQPIDFTKPIEAFRATDGVVVPMTYVRCERYGQRADHLTANSPDPLESNCSWHDDGSNYVPGSHWYLRNRQPEQPQPSRISDDVVERMVRAIKAYANGNLLEARLNGRTVHTEMLELASALPEFPSPVDPDLIEARKWCIDRANDLGLDEAADRVARGDGDENPTVRDYLAGIKRGRELAANEKGEG